MKKVLVTGGAGFIGTQTVRLLVEKGYKVRVLDNLSPRVHPSADLSRLPDAAEFVKADITDREAMLDALQGVDRVIHLAAYQDHLTDFSTFFKVNTAGTALLYELIHQHDELTVEKIVNVSTQAVYGDAKYVCAEHGIFTGIRSDRQLREGDWEAHCPVCHAVGVYKHLEEEDADPVTAYGLSKHAAERLSLQLGAKYGIPTACIRYSLVQGPGQSIHNAYSGIGRIFNQRMRAGEAPVLYEDGDQIRDFVHVEDVAEANVLLMESEKSAGQVYNAGGAEPTTVKQYAQLLNELYNNRFELMIPGVARYGDPRHTFSSSRRLEELGWKRKKSLRNIIQDTYDWFQTLHNPEAFREAELKMFEQGVLKKVTGRSMTT